VKSLYGLKLAGRLWNKLLHETLLEIGFVQSVTDACVYYKSTKEGTITLGTYVDELLATATTDSLLDEFGRDMASLKLKDLGPVENSLGIRIDYDEERGYRIDQEQTIVELLQKNRMEKVNAVRAPIADESSLESESKESEPLPGAAKSYIEWRSSERPPAPGCGVEGIARRRIMNCRLCLLHARLLEPTDHGWFLSGANRLVVPS
jgi:hypothetical protein